MSTLAFPGQHEPAFKRSVSLSALVHIVLFAVMFLGVRWQSHRPDVVEVELWEAPAARPPAVAPAPPPPAPPKVEPKKVEAKPKPDPKFEKQLREQAAAEQKVLDEARREQALRDLLARAQ